MCLHWSEAVAAIAERMEALSTDIADRKGMCGFCCFFLFVSFKGKKCRCIDVQYGAGPSGLMVLVEVIKCPKHTPTHTHSHTHIHSHTHTRLRAPRLRNLASTRNRRTHAYGLGMFPLTLAVAGAVVVAAQVLARTREASGLFKALKRLESLSHRSSRLVIERKVGIILVSNMRLRGYDGVGPDRVIGWLQTRG